MRRCGSSDQWAMLLVKLMITILPVAKAQMTLWLVKGPNTVFKGEVRVIQVNALQKLNTWTVSQVIRWLNILQKHKKNAARRRRSITRRLVRWKQRPWSRGTEDQTQALPRAKFAKLTHEEGFEITPKTMSLLDSHPEAPKDDNDITNQPKVVPPPPKVRTPPQQTSITTPPKKAYLSLPSTSTLFPEKPKVVPPPPKVKTTFNDKQLGKIHSSPPSKPPPSPPPRSIACKQPWKLGPEDKRFHVLFNHQISTVFSLCCFCFLSFTLTFYTARNR